MEMLRDKESRSPKADQISIDYQAWIRVFNRPKNQAGRDLLKRIVDWYYDLSGERNITLHRIFAHEGVLDNERADTAAKEATSWRERRIRIIKADQ